MDRINPHDPTGWLSIQKAAAIDVKIKEMQAQGKSDDDINALLAKSKLAASAPQGATLNIDTISTRLSDTRPQFMNGMTLNYLDEIKGGLGKLRGEDYTTTRDNARTDIAALRKAHPTKSAIAEGVGTLIPAAVLSRFAGAGPALAGTVLRQAGAGAVTGGVDAYGAETDGFDPWREALGATTGAGTGIAGSLLGAGLGSIMNFIRAIKNPKFSAATAAPKMGMDPAQMDKVLADGLLPVDATERAATSAKDLIKVVKDPNPIRAKIITPTRDPKHMAYDTLYAEKFPNEPIAKVEDLKKAADTHFQALRAKPNVKLTPEIQAIMDTQAGHSAYQKAISTMTDKEIQTFETAKEIPFDVLERMRQVIPDLMPASMKNAGADLSKNLVTQTNDPAWPDAIAASSKHHTAASLEEGTKALIDPKLQRHELEVAAEKLLEKPPAAGTVYDLGKAAVVNRSNEAVRTGTSRAITNDGSEVTGREVAAVGAGSPRWAQFTVIKQLLDTLQSKGVKASAEELGKMLTNDDPHAWRKIKALADSAKSTSTSASQNTNAALQGILSTVEARQRRRGT